MSSDLKLSRGVGTKVLALILIASIAIGGSALYYGWYAPQQQQQQQMYLSAILGIPFGQINILTAGSLTNILDTTKNKFEAKNYYLVNVYISAYGSSTCANYIKQGTPCDVFFSADYQVIRDELCPIPLPDNPLMNYADWWVSFARNELVIMYSPTTTIGSIINETNWYNLLITGQGTWARSDPDADPCGRRALITLNISDTYYPEHSAEYPGYPGHVLDYVMTMPDHIIVVAKAFDIVAGMQSGQIDAGFEYESIALQYGLPYITLPENVSLGNPSEDYDAWYSQWSIDTGENVFWGSSIKYALTIPNTAQNVALAIEFTKYVLSPEGQSIFTDGGQPVIDPPIAEGNLAKIPSAILSLCTT